MAFARVGSLTGVLQLHPGGKQIILKYAGKDATAAYKPIHPEDALEKNLAKEKHLGPVDTNAVEEMRRADANRKKTRDEFRMEQAKLGKPPLERILTLQDMEVRSGLFFPHRRINDGAWQGCCKRYFTVQG